MIASVFGRIAVTLVVGSATRFDNKVSLNDDLYEDDDEEDACISFFFKKQDQKAMK